MPTPGSPPARIFRKTAAALDVFTAEVDGLLALKNAGVTVPAPLSHGISGGTAFLHLEFLELKKDGDWAALARMLAGMHRASGPRYGWHRDNYIGAAPQQNGWCDDWGEFWRERRLRPQFERAGIRPEFFDELLQTHQPQRSLLHGDLWSGNAGFTAQGPVVYDPAVYYGDREADLAMTELFGGFPREFYAAYDAAYPLAEGYQTRKHLYNLYHLLNHLNLFGAGYRRQVEASLGLLRDAL